MKYYIGYFDKPWDKSEFTVICGYPSKHAAIFILEQYRKEGPAGVYEMLSAAEAMDINLVF